MKIIFQTKKEESYAPPYGHKVIHRSKAITITQIRIIQSFYFTAQGSIPYKWFHEDLKSIHYSKHSAKEPSSLYYVYNFYS